MQRTLPTEPAARAPLAHDGRGWFAHRRSKVILGTFFLLAAVGVFGLAMTGQHVPGRALVVPLGLSIICFGLAAANPRY